MNAPLLSARARRRGGRRVVALSVVVLALGLSLGCARSPEVSGPPSTLAGVGRLPEELSADPIDVFPALPLIDVEDSGVFEPVGEIVGGNRLLVIGDSIMASASRRYGNEICDVLVPLGWEVEVNAEVGRFIEFGNQVLRNRFDPVNDLDWDAAVISLGTNYNGDPERYRSALESILDRLDPRPVVLLTVTEWRDEMSEVNDVVVDMMRTYPFVQVVDWAAITGNDERLLQRDGIHLTEAGRDRLARVMADVLGTAEGEGLCRESRFSDDSAGEGSVDIGVTTTRPSTTSEDESEGSADSDTGTGDGSGSGGGSGDGSTGDGSDSGSGSGTGSGSGDGSGDSDSGSGSDIGSGSATTTPPAPEGEAPPDSDG